jgi:phosphoribulokinase
MGMLLLQKMDWKNLNEGEFLAIEQSTGNYCMNGPGHLAHYVESYDNATAYFLSQSTFI